MPRPIFQDVHPAYHGSDSYRCTNEELSGHLALIGEKTFKRSGGIISSGDVLLGVLLPRSEEFIGADHNTVGIGAAYCKMVMLDQLGPQQFHSLMVNGTYPTFLAAAQNALTEMPGQLRDKLAPVGRHPFHDYDYNAMQTEWKAVPQDAIILAHQRLDKVTLLHGDLEDLRSHGQFDCLYVSNAIVGGGHAGRHGYAPGFAHLAPLVREDGQMVVARSYGTLQQKAPTTGWKKAKTQPKQRLGWDYDLWTKTPEPVQVGV